MAVLQDAEFRGLSVVYQSKSSFIQIQFYRLKEASRVVLGDRVVPIQFNKPYLGCRHVGEVTLAYFPATYEVYSKVEL